MNKFQKTWSDYQPVKTSWISILLLLALAIIISVLFTLFIAKELKTPLFSPVVMASTLPSPCELESVQCK